MYRVIVKTDGKEYPLLNKILRLESPTLQEKAGNSPDYLKFKISPTHPHYGNIDALRSELFVFEDGVEIFRGRSITTQETFNRTRQMTCESDIAYLCDSIVRPFEFQGSIYQFLEKIISNHNSQVEERKQFQIGNVNVVDNNNYINRSNSDYSNSLDCLRNKLVETHGGYLRTRLQDGIRYLDYVTDAGGINDQEIRYGVNLADYSRQRDATTLFTALIPTGADMEITGEDGSVETKAVDITSVNNGVDYIYDEEAVNKYGWIFRQQKWEDVTLPENLLAKARAYLEQCIYLDDVLQLTAVDLANMGNDIGRLKVGRWTKVKSRPHGIDVLYMLEERTRYLQEPGKDTVSLGGTVPRLSGSVAKSQAKMTAYVQQVAQSTGKELNRKVDNATQLITGGLGGYVVIGRSDNGQPEEILIMDAPTKETATNVIRLNKNGIGFSNTGYNGTYRNAWTIDGNLVADFITTGTLNAGLIKAGIISDQTEKSKWNMDTGEMVVSGTLEQYRSDGYKSVRVANNGLWLYSYLVDNQLMGGVSSMFDSGSTKDIGVAFDVMKGKLLTIGLTDESNAVYPIIQLTGEENTPPAIAGTASGKIPIPGGGTITVNNGLITAWEMPGLPSGKIDYYDGSFGEIQIWVTDGAITKWIVDSN